MQNGYFKTIFQTAGSFVVVSHIRPDGDAVGSVIAAGLALRDMGKNVAMVIEHALQPSYRFLPGSELLLTADGISTAPAPGGCPATEELRNRHFTCGIVLDCTGLERTGECVQGILNQCEFLINIDHHISNNGFGAVNIIDAEASATGEILYRVMSGLGIPISPDVATNLYTAIVTDSGSFRYPNATSRCHQVASELLELGADHCRVQQCLNEQKSFSSLRLLEKGLSTLTLEQDGQIAWIALSRHFYEETGCGIGDSDEIINYPRSIAGVEVGILFKEVEAGEVRIGFRSKNLVDVNLLAGRFGGGGHERAAGCTVKGSLPEVEAIVVAATKEYLTDLKSESKCVTRTNL
jgi:phosphoesterase RecJ-like protein